MIIEILIVDVGGDEVVRMIIKGVNHHQKEEKRVIERLIIVRKIAKAYFSPVYFQ